MPEISKGRNIIPFVCIFLIILISFFSLSISPPTIIEVHNQSHNDIPVGEIYGRIKIGQTFKADHNNLRAIEILLATFNRENKGTFVFRLRKGLKSEDTIFKYYGNMREVQDNTFFRFSIPKLKDYKGNEILLLKGEKYYFFLEAPHLEAPHAEPGNAITIWSSSDDLYKDGEKIINGVSSQGDLVFKTEYELGWRLSFHTLVARLMNILNFFLNLFKNQVFYFVLFLILLTWVFITLVEKYRILHKKGGLLLVFGIIFGAVLLCIILLFSKKIEVYNQFENTIQVGEIFGEKKAGQTFIAQYDHLMAVELLLGTYARKNKGELIFHLKENGEKEDLYHYEVEMSKIKNNRYHHFKIPDIENSKGKNYYFYLEAPTARPGNAITIWCIDEEDKYREGAKIINGEEMEGDLVFKTIYAVGLWRKIGLFLGEITQNKSSPMNKKMFYVGLIVSFVLTCSLFLTYIVRVFVETHAAKGNETNSKKLNHNSKRPQ